MKIIICGSAFPFAEGVLSPMLPDDRIEMAGAESLAAAVRTADILVPMMTRIDAALIDLTSATLIQQWGAGLEGVDVDAATDRGIYVANVPSDITANAESTAEHAVFLMMGAARRLRTCARSFDEGVWGAPLGEALFGRRALIVGFGRVGKALAPRLVTMGMKVDAVRRQPEAGEATRYGLDRLGTPADLLRFAADADFVVSTSTATADSRGMLNAAVFGAMKRSAFVVNVSRGSVVDEAALIAALREKRIAGAALDVFAEEPVRRDHPLLVMEQVVATPHIAGVTVQSYDGMGRAIAENIRRLKAGDAPVHCVNLERLTLRRAEQRR